MLSKWQKFLMYLIGFFAMILGIAAIFPLRAFWPEMDFYHLESMIKLIYLPIIILILSLYPNILKYRQITNYREQSKIVSFTSYFPIACYLIGLLSFALYTLSKSAIPFTDVGLGLGFYSLWVVIIISTLVIIFIGIFTFNRFEMRLSAKEHIILDLSIFILIVFYILLINKINQIYRLYFELNVPRIGTIGEIELLFIFGIYIILFVIGVKRLFYFIQADEINLAVKMSDIDSTSDLAYNVEYNRAYNAILRKFESSYAEELEEVEQGTEVEKQLEVQPVEEQPIVEETVVDKPADEKVNQVKEVNEPEIIEVIEEKVLPVDEAKLAELASKKLEIEQVKAEVAKQEEQMKALESDIVNQETIVLPKEEVKPKLERKPKLSDQIKKEIIPSFHTLINYAKSIPNITVIENETKTNIRFMVGKKVFLIANETKRDYRLTFLYDLQEIVNLMINYPVVVKATTPKGDNWFKLVNKGDMLEEDLFDIIDKAHATLLLLEERKAAGRTQSRAKSRL